MPTTTSYTFGLPDMVSLVGSLISIAIAIIAIWLSITFFRMASGSSREIRETTARLDTTIQRLEELVRGLHSETVRALTETYTDIRRHMWGDASPVTDEIKSEVERRADEKLEKLKAEVNARLAPILDGQAKADARLEAVQELVDRALVRSSSIQSEAREEALRSTILSVLDQASGPLAAQKLLDEVRRKDPTLNCEVSDLIAELTRLRDEVAITYSGQGAERDVVFPDTQVVLRPRK